MVEFMNPIIEKIRSNAEICQKNTSIIMETLTEISPSDGVLFDFNTIVEGTIGTVSDVLSRTMICCNMLIDLVKNVDNNIFIIPKNAINNIHNTLIQLTETINNILTLLQQTNKIQISRIDYPSMIFVRQDNNSSLLNLGPDIKKIDSNIDAILSIYLQISNVIDSKTSSNLDVFVDSIRGSINEIHNVRRELLNELRAARSKSTQIGNKNSEIEEKLNQTNKYINEISESYKNLKEKEQQINILHNKLIEIDVKSSTLSESISSYQEKFNAFDRLLDERIKNFENGKRDLEKLIDNSQVTISNKSESLNKIENELRNIASQSQHILGNATAAGLASMFREAGKRLKWPLIASHIIFYVSVTLLIFSLLIVLDGIPFIRGYIELPHVTPPSGVSTADAIIFIFGSVLVRFVLILPGLLLAGFATRWHRSLQQLSEEYMHKEAVSASVPGFKGETEGDLREVIPAAAFENLLSYKGNYASSDGTSLKNQKWLERLIRRPIERAIDLAVKNKKDIGKED